MNDRALQSLKIRTVHVSGDPASHGRDMAAQDSGSGHLEMKKRPAGSGVPPVEASGGRAGLDRGRLSKPAKKYVKIESKKFYTSEREDLEGAPGTPILYCNACGAPCEKPMFFENKLVIGIEHGKECAKRPHGYFVLRHEDKNFPAQWRISHRHARRQIRGRVESREQREKIQEPQAWLGPGAGLAGGAGGGAGAGATHIPMMRADLPLPGVEGSAASRYGYHSAPFASTAGIVGEGGGIASMGMDSSMQNLFGDPLYLVNSMAPHPAAMLQQRQLYHQQSQQQQQQPSPQPQQQQHHQQHPMMGSAHVHRSVPMPQNLGNRTQMTMQHLGLPSMAYSVKASDSNGQEFYSREASGESVVGSSAGASKSYVDVGSLSSAGAFVHGGRGNGTGSSTISEETSHIIHHEGAEQGFRPGLASALASYPHADEDEENTQYEQYPGMGRYAHTA